MSSTDNAQQIIVGCLAGTVVVSAGSSLAQGNAPSSRLLVGLGFSGLGLAAVAMYAPGLASGFATLMLVATTITYGQPLLDYITSATAVASTGQLPPTSPSPAPRPARPTTPQQTGLAT